VSNIRLSYKSLSTFCLETTIRFVAQWQNFTTIKLKNGVPINLVSTESKGIAILNHRSHVFV